jgi:HK97 family phage major capsid protein
MKTIKEQITALEATRQAKAGALEAVQSKVSGEGRTKDESEREEFNALKEEIGRLDEELKDLAAMEGMNLEKAAPVEPSAGTSEHAAKKAREGAVVPNTTRIFTKANIEPGIRFARMAMAIARAKAAGGMMGTPEMVYRADKRWMDTSPEIAEVFKTAVNAGDSTTAGWALEWAYAQNIASEFIEFLRPQTIIGRVSGWRAVPFNVRVGSQTAGSTGYWVGQGKAIPMSKLTSSSVSLGIAKVAGLVSIDKELARLSTPAAETLVRNDLARECQETLDLSLIDPNQGGQANIQPASLTYGVTPVTPSGTNYAAFVTDVKSLFTTAITANLDISQATWVLSPTTALALSLMVTSLGNPQFPGLTINGGTLMGLPAVVTTQATISGSPQYSNIMVLIFPGEVFLADDGPAVEASDQVSIQMGRRADNA